MSLISDIPIILASTSPRRHELLNQVAISHKTFGVQIDETQYSHETPIEYIQRMVSQKAKATLENFEFAEFFAKNFANQTQALLITADTIGVLANGQVLQKPKDFADAFIMWQQMSDTEHQVWTAVQVSFLHQEKQHFVLMNFERKLVKTLVSFIKLNDSMMTAYWQTGEPQDKAGGYAIQGQGASWVKSIHGSYSNVVGLPLVETIELLKQASPV